MGRSVERGYYNSEHWKLKRKEAFKFHGSFCAKCNSRSRLVVHHLTYANVWAEKMEDLQILCEDCHNIHHGGSPRGKGKGSRKKKRVKGSGERNWLSQMNRRQREEHKFLVSIGREKSSANKPAKRKKKTRRKKKGRRTAAGHKQLDHGLDAALARDN